MSGALLERALRGILFRRRLPRPAPLLAALPNIYFVCLKPAARPAPLSAALPNIYFVCLKPAGPADLSFPQGQFAQLPAGYAPRRTNKSRGFSLDGKARKKPRTCHLETRPPCHPEERSDEGSPRSGVLFHRGGRAGTKGLRGCSTFVISTEERSNATDRVEKSCAVRIGRQALCRVLPCSPFCTRSLHSRCSVGMTKGSVLGRDDRGACSDSGAGRRKAK